MEILNDIHFLGKQKLETDSIFKIGDHYFHVECESKEGKFSVRFIEYDFIIALESTQRKADGTVHLRFPYSGILMLRHNSKTPDKEKIIIQYPDGEEKTLYYHIMKAQSYDIETIFQKNLYFLIPFYITRYEIKKSTKGFNQEIMEKQILNGMKQILERLKTVCQENGNLDLCDDIELLTKVIVRHYLEGSQSRKDVDDMGRGKILELPSDRIKAERAKAEAERARAVAAEARIKELEERLRKYEENPALL